MKPLWLKSLLAELRFCRIELEVAEEAAFAVAESCIAEKEIFFAKAETGVAKEEVIFAVAESCVSEKEILFARAELCIAKDDFRSMLKRASEDRKSVRARSIVCTEKWRSYDLHSNNLSCN